MNIFWQIILLCLIKKLFEFFFIVKYIPPRVGFGFPSLSSIISYIATTRLNGRAGSDSYNKLTCENLVMGRCLEILILEGGIRVWTHVSSVKFEDNDLNHPTNHAQNHFSEKSVQKVLSSYSLKIILVLNTASKQSQST